MSQLPPKFDPPEEIDDRYRRLSALDRTRPSGGVRDAVLAHARWVAEANGRRVAEANAAGGGSQEQRGAAGAAADADRASGRRRRLWRGPVVFGTLAAAALAGLLILPRVVMTPEVSRSKQLIASRATSDLKKYGPAPMEAPPAPWKAPVETLAPAESAVNPPPESKMAAAVIPKAARESSRASAQRAMVPQAVVPRAMVPRAMVPQVVAPPAASPADATTAPPRDTSGTLQEVVVTGARIERNEMASSIAAIASGERATPAPAAAPVIQLPPDEAMLRAVETGDFRALKKSIKDSADVNSRDGAGRTALLLATQKGDTKAVKLLLSRGADPNVADSTGVTPLQAATTAKQDAIRRLLEHAGARD
jgi:hypothetical protein